MSSDAKTAIFGFGLAGLVFWALNSVFKKKEEEQLVPITPEGTATALKAYKLALDAGEDLDALNKLNKQLEQQYGVNVAINAGGEMIVSNQKGTEIKRVYYGEV
jgi:hypothetical protein